LITEYLKGEFGDIKHVSAQQASVLYAVDRFAASKDMKEWLDKGGIIICNRYVSANKGHQLAKIGDVKAREEFLDWLNNFEYKIMGIPKEDVDILLYVPPEIGQLLGQENLKHLDIHEQDMDHQKKAAEAYKYVAKKEGWEIIDCTRDGKLLGIDEIHAKLYDVVKKYL